MTGTAGSRLVHAAADRIPHAGNGEQVECFLDGAPVVFRDEYGITLFARDHDRLIAVLHGGDQTVECRAGFGGCDGHMSISYAFAYGIATSFSAFFYNVPRPRGTGIVSMGSRKSGVLQKKYPRGSIGDS